MYVCEHCEESTIYKLSNLKRLQIQKHNNDLFYVLPSVGKRGPKGERGDPGKPHPGLPGPAGIQGNSSKLECIVILYNSIQQRFQKAAHSR